MIAPARSRIPLLVGLVWLTACRAGPIASTTSSEGSSDGADEETTTPEDAPSPEDLPPQPEQGTWEGLLELCEPDWFPPPVLYSHFLPCGSDERWRIEGEPIWPVNGCTAIWVVASGTLVHDPGTCLFEGAPDHERVLIVDELLEVRLCEPSDCGGSPLCEPETFDCWHTPGCWPLMDDCPEGERCIAHDYDEEFDFDPPHTQCVSLARTPLQVGEPCLVWDPFGDNFDECDKGLLCVPLADGDPEGTCRAFCDPAGVYLPPCNGNCAPCHPAADHGAGLCFEDCPNCEATPYC